MVKKFYIETYGCQMNVADSEVVAAILTAAGFEHTTDKNEADVILVNTCSVRENAEQRVRGRVQGFSEIRKRSPPGRRDGLYGRTPGGETLRRREKCQYRRRSRCLYGPASIDRTGSTRQKSHQYRTFYHRDL